MSPAGFSEAKTDYAEKFFQAKDAPVDEWRFHKFYWPQSYTGWEAAVKGAGVWSRDHGAPMVLGSFGSPADDTAGVDMRPYQRQAMMMLAQESCIVEAVWFSFDFFPSGVHTLVNPDGSLTQDGDLFVNLM